MTAVSAIRPDIPVQLLIQQLNAAGLGAECSPRSDGYELIISNVATGKSCLSLTGTRQACWHYEPLAGSAIHSAALTAIVGHLLAAPYSAQAVPDPNAYRAFPLKGQVGRMLENHCLTVTLRVTEDWETFEATTDIDVTNPARPWLGTVTMADNADLDWHLDWRAAFGENPAALIDIVAPVLCSTHIQQGTAGLRQVPYEIPTEVTGIGPPL